MIGHVLCKAQHVPRARAPMRAFGADGTLRYALEAIARHSERLCVTFSELMMLAFNFRIAPQERAGVVALLCVPRARQAAPGERAGPDQGRVGRRAVCGSCALWDVHTNRLA